MPGPFQRVGDGPRVRTPLLILLSAAFFGFGAAVMALTLALMIAVALFGDGPFTFNGEPVSRAEFLRRAPLVWLGLGLPAVYLGALSVGVWRQRAWVRPAVLVFWLLVSAILVAQAAVADVGWAEAVGASALYLGSVGWYFYGKSNVVAYYRTLERREREAAHHPPTSEAA